MTWVISSKALPAQKKIGVVKQELVQTDVSDKILKILLSNAGIKCKWARIYEVDIDTLLISKINGVTSNHIPVQLKSIQPLKKLFREGEAFYNTMIDSIIAEQEWGPDYFEYKALFIALKNFKLDLIRKNAPNYSTHFIDRNGLELYHFTDHKKITSKANRKLKEWVNNQHFRLV